MVISMTYAPCTRQGAWWYNPLPWQEQIKRIHVSKANAAPLLLYLAPTLLLQPHIRRSESALLSPALHRLHLWLSLGKPKWGNGITGDGYQEEGTTITRSIKIMIMKSPRLLLLHPIILNPILPVYMYIFFWI